MKEKTVCTIGWIGSGLGIIMYASFIDQIRLNLNGHKGSLILPLATFVNCSVWFMYGFFKNKKDWPLIVPNILGIILGIIAVITAVY